MAIKRPPNKPARTTPPQGGRLVTKTSSEVPGFENYTWKHDWRRDLTDEMRREGDDFFHPNMSIPIGNQPFPQRRGFEISGFANGDFELDTDSDLVPDGWTKSLTGGVTMTLDTSVYANDGSEQSVKFNSTSGTASGYLESDTAMLVTPGRLWRISFKLKADTAAINVAVRIVWYDEDGVAINDALGNPEWSIYNSTVNPTADFATFTYDATPPVQAVSGRLRFYGKVNPSAVGNVWFDSVTLVEAESTILPINLVHQVRRPNGKQALIVGTKTTLYRYFAFDDGDYFLRDEDVNYFAATGPDTPYFDIDDEYFDLSAAPGGYFTDTGPGTPYFGSNTGEWRIIGSGFSPLGHRWEALNINGYAVFNNGIDLPVTYQEQDERVVPIYELREAGIAFLGTIWENTGVLMGGDVGQIKEQIFDDTFQHESSGLTKAKQYGSVNSVPTTATIQDGVALRSAYAGGSTGYVSTPHSASLASWATGITVEAWIKMSSPEEGGVIAIKGTPFSDFEFSVGEFNLLFTAGLFTMSAAFNYTGWVHVAATVGPLGSRLYINGLEFDSNSSTAVPNGTPTALLACKSNVAFNNFDMADLRIWNEARSQAQIQAYMSSDPPITAALKLWHKFDEGTGTSIADSSGNANTGTLTGPAFATWIATASPADAFIKTSPVAAASMTRVIGVVTFTGVAKHNLSVGDLITISGATQTDYNGDWIVATVADPFIFTFSIGGLTPATPATGAPVVQERFFTAGMVGKFISFSNGFTTRINGFINGTRVKVDDSASSLTGLNLSFRLYNTSNAQLTGTVTRSAGLATLAGVGTLFTTELSVGQLVRVGDEVRKITVITSDTALTVESNWIASGAGTTLFRVTDFTVLSDANIFDVSDVGRHIYWPDGSSRLITGYQNATRVTVDAHMAVNEGVFELENITAYDAITDENSYDRIQYRAIWGAKDEPRTFASAVPVSIAEGSSTATLKYPVLSLETGMQITILGAGTLGADFAATIILVGSDHRSLVLNRAAETGVVDALLQRTSSIGSIAGFEDLQDDDSSAIIAGKDLRGRTVVYKDTSIFLCDYTGVPASPFSFTRVYQGADSLYFKFTLIDPQGTYHLYAAKNGFYTFDLTSQVPQRIELFDYIDNLFFPTAKIIDTDLIFSGLCGPTKEVFIMFPIPTGLIIRSSRHPFFDLASAGVDNGVRGFAYDFKYKTLSTIGVAYTAINTVPKPVPGIPIGVQEEWCICGGGDGSVILYGKANGPQEQWGGKTATYSRRGSAYRSILRGGLFGGGYRELDITGYLPEVSSQSRPNITSLLVNLYGYRNPAELPKLLFSRDVPVPDQNNLIPCFFRRNFIQDEIVIGGSNNPFRLAARTVEIGSVDSKSQSRRPL